MTDLRPRTEPLVKVSIVAPAFNEEETLPRFTDAIDDVLSKAGLPYEIVFVNDGSTDGTLSLMRRLRAQNDRITIVNLSRNFGKEIAMTAGIAHAKGTVIVIIDTDLQDPPELIPQLVESWREGYDVVYAQRRVREGETWLKKTTASWFYKLMQFAGPVTIPRDTGDFRLISQRVAKALLELPEQHRFMKGLYSWVGFPQKSLPYDRHARFAGTTKWNYWKLWNLAIEGITSFTIAPLKLASYAGFFAALIAAAYTLYIIGRTLIYGDPVAGFPTLLAVIVFLGGIQLLVLGIIGEYLGRVFNETKRRPLFLVESVEWSTTPAEKRS